MHRRVKWTYEEIMKIKVELNRFDFILASWYNEQVQ